MKTDNIQDIYELSPLQQGILFHSLYAPESAVYIVQLSYLLRGNLNVIAFAKAWQEVVIRHSVLRTAFYWETLEKPLQVVHQEVQISITQQDWRDISPNEQPQKLQVFLEQDRAANFDLSQPCLMRLHLIRCPDNSYYFVWSKHHLILDGWSTALVLKEVVELYQALCQGENLPVVFANSFGDYIGWLQQQDLNKAKIFWQQLLKGVTAPTPLINLNVNNSSQQPEKYEQQVIKLSSKTTTALQSLAKTNQLTLNTLVQGAWSLLLSRYSGETDVVYGVTVSGRPTDLDKSEFMVGMFINTLPIRIRVNSEESLLSWLKKLQSQLAEIQQYEYSPLVEVQGCSEIPRSLSLFESILVFENYPIDGVLKNGMQDLETQLISSVDNTNYPLTVICLPGAELQIKISYNCDRFHLDTIDRMLKHLATLLENMIVDVNQPLVSLSMMTAFEKHQLLVEWNNTQVDYPRDKCIHQLFAEQVEKTPDAIAVVFEGQQLSYHELNQRANQLARYLQKLGVKAQELVGICIERSLEMVIGILAILKAGGAYVPLDPTYPTERLDFVIKDAQLKVILTQQKLSQQLPARKAQLVCLDTDWEIIAQQSQVNPGTEITPTSLAYIIYTSGSTGKPKGVLVNHANVVRLFAATESWFKFNAHHVWTLFHSIAFDFSVWEIWGALLYGGRLVVVPFDISRSPEAFYDLLSQQQVTVLNQTPSAFRQLIRVSECVKTPDKLKHLCYVIFGGETLDIQNLQPWFASYGDKFPQLVNMYGITETTVHVTYCPLTIADLAPTQGSLIGRPIPDLQVYVLDQHQQLLPIGVPGEMYVGGVGLARGYLNRPELTQQRFISNPFVPETSLYRSGDLARYLPNGKLEYLGRIDNQVKIRGFRIELGEIEAILNLHPLTREAAVVVRDDIPADKRLVAYVVPELNANLKQTELRGFLKQHLPEYMLPSAFVLIDTLPLTPNGKIDRRALPAPTPSNLELADTFVEPRTAVEEILAGIWAKTLHIERIGIHDNFFELGGHSLLATQVVSRIREIFRSELPLRCLFESPTVAKLSQTIIAKESKPGLTEKMAQILKKLEGMSDEEAKQALQNRKVITKVITEVNV